MKLLKSPKKLTIEISEEYHRRIKLLAVERNITLRKWVIQTLLERVLREESTR
jgi:predicted HicB family RNase H-like nuclease